MKGVLGRRQARRSPRPRSASRRRLFSGGLEPVERLIVGVTVLVFVLAAGTTGYVLLGLGALDALYQTVITVSTVGYSDPAGVGARYQIFTIALILLGTGTSLYTIGVVIEMLFEGRLDDHIRRRRMQRSIDSLSDHAVICGYGQVGQAIAEAMIDAGTDVVLIDSNLDIDSGDLHLLSGDATHDSTLQNAGIEKASSLVVALDSDADNLYVTLSARAMCPELFIVTRANSPGALPKLRQAGADRVINPHQIGGAYMASAALRRDATEGVEDTSAP